MNAVSKALYFGVGSLVSLKAMAQLDPFGSAEIQDELKGNSGAEAEEAIQQFIGWILGFLWLIVFVYFLYGGFVILTAGGNDENVKKGRKIIVNAIIGAIVIFLAWTLTELLFEILQGESANP